MKSIFIFLLFPLLIVAGEPLPEAQWRFVSSYCTDCHDEDMNEGNLNLDFQKVDWTKISSRKHWDDVYTMLERG